MKSSPGLKPPWGDQSSAAAAGKPQHPPSHPSYHTRPHTRLCNRQEQSLEWKHNTYITTEPGTVQLQQTPAWFTKTQVFTKERSFKKKTGVTFAAAVRTFIITYKSMALTSHHMTKGYVICYPPLCYPHQIIYFPVAERAEKSLSCLLLQQRCRAAIHGFVTP